jgi:hypothetical protein
VRDASKVVSFTPGFSPVLKMSITENRFNGFPFVSLWKPLKRFQNNVSAFHRAKARCE